MYFFIVVMGVIMIKSNNNGRDVNESEVHLVDGY
jgi:hypothetical protein